MFMDGSQSNMAQWLSLMSRSAILNLHLGSMRIYIVIASVHAPVLICLDHNFYIHGWISEF